NNRLPAATCLRIRPVWALVSGGQRTSSDDANEGTAAATVDRGIELAACVRDIREKHRQDATEVIRARTRRAAPPALPRGPEAGRLRHLFETLPGGSAGAVIGVAGRANRIMIGLVVDVAIRQWGRRHAVAQQRRAVEVLGLVVRVVPLERVAERVESLCFAG